MFVRSDEIKMKRWIFYIVMVIAAGVVHLAEPKVAMADTHTTVYNIGSMVTPISNTSGAIADEVNGRTQFESLSELNLTRSSFKGGIWNKELYLYDWDGDGTQEACVRFTSPASSMNFGIGEDATMTIGTTVNPLSINAVNPPTTGEIELKYGLTPLDTYNQLTANPYSQISESTDAGVVITNNPGQVYWGESVNINVNPTLGHYLEAISGHDAVVSGNADAGYVVSVSGNGNTSLSATSATNQNTLNISLGGGGGMVTGSGINTTTGDNTITGDYGTGFTLTATAATNYQFVGWVGCDAPVDEVCTQTLNQNNGETEFVIAILV